MMIGASGNGSNGTDGRRNSPKGRTKPHGFKLTGSVPRKSPTMSKAVPAFDPLCNPGQIDQGAESEQP
jgi:hypothetical protein